MENAATVPDQRRARGARGAGVFERVLCAVDGKDGGFTAVEQAAALSAPGASMTILAVTSFRADCEHRGPAVGPLQTQHTLERAERIAAEAGVAATVEVDPAGPPAQVILDWSEGHDLLAIGAPASSWLGGMVISGVADTALSSLVVPLLVARELSPPAHVAQRILIATDGLDGSERPVALAARLADICAADVTLLHATGHALAGSHHEPAQARAHGQLRLLKSGAQGGSAEVRMLKGSAPEAIIAAAEDLGASLVVMGSRRLDGLRAIGSVSRRVAHAAHCSVLLVPPAPPG